jgi:hypothetical protein
MTFLAAAMAILAVLVYVMDLNVNTLYWRWVGHNTEFTFEIGDSVSRVGSTYTGVLGRVVRRDVCWRNRGSGGVLVGYDQIPIWEPSAEIYQVRLLRRASPGSSTYQLEWYDVHELMNPATIQESERLRSLRTFSTMTDSGSWPRELGPTAPHNQLPE